MGIGAVLSKSQVRVALALALIELFTKLPVVKSIYSSLKSFFDYFAPSSKPGRQQMVILRMPDNELEVVGLVTRRSSADLPSGFHPGDRVAVCLPMGT